MFPHACGDALEQAVAAGADPRTVVPDDWIVVRGGMKPVPASGTGFSATAGPTVEAAACAVPHGSARVTTAGAIRVGGGMVVWQPETSPHGTINKQHVHVVEAGLTSFSEPVPNPVPKRQRIDGGT